MELVDVPRRRLGVSHKALVCLSQHSCLCFSQLGCVVMVPGERWRGEGEGRDGRVAGGRWRLAAGAVGRR